MNLWRDAAALLLVLLLIAGAALWAQSQRIDALRTTRKQAVDALDAALEANKTDADTIGALRKANAQWEAKHALDEQIIKNVTEGVIQYEGVVRALNDKLDALQEKDRGNPDCDALLDRDLSAVCPGTASGLRLRAAGRDAN